MTTSLHNSAAAPTPPGWYTDPWDSTGWRWWDGSAWTPHTTVQTRKPRLPAWLSIPVLVCAVIVVPAIVFVAVRAPLAVALALITLAVVLPVMKWLDRVEPEPKSELVHAFLWGATVAILVAMLVNTTVSVVAGLPVATVLSAPLVEEAMKAGAVLYAVRRRQLDGPMDGIVFAGWTAVGFAAVENIQYFIQALDSGQLVGVFVARGLLSPFAHPLFTAWTGLAIGLAVSRGRPVFPSALWGYALAVLSHALWNGSATAAQMFGAPGAVLFLLTAICFVILFATFAAMLYRQRRREERQFCRLVPWLAQRYQLAPDEVAVYGNFSDTLKTRRRLPKQQRQSFDRMHSALARLATVHSRPNGATGDDERPLLAQLQRARSDARGNLLRL